MSSINKNGPPSGPRAPTDSSPERAQTALEQKLGGLGLPEAPGRPTKSAQVEQQQAERPDATPQARKLSQAEAERLYSQAGFQRAGRKRGRGVELDDVTQGPIPLPVDEVDESSWDQQSLDDAQQELTVQSLQLGELKAQSLPGEAPMAPLQLAKNLAGKAFAPTDKDMQRLQALQDAPAPPAPNLVGVGKTMAGRFGLDLSDLPAGPAMVAAALVVAGLPEAVVVQQAQLQAEPFVDGMQKVISRSNGAVEGARTMSSGISKQMALQRTFVFKRK